MATDPNQSLPPKAMPSAANHGMPPLSQSDLANFSLRELLGMLLSNVGVAERKAYLERLLEDKPNGFYDRSLQLGTMPLEVRVPRTRSGDFRPASLPALYQRGYSDETQSLLLSLLSSGRSLHAVKDALQKMGLSTQYRRAPLLDCEFWWSLCAAAKSKPENICQGTKLHCTSFRFVPPLDSAKGGSGVKGRDERPAGALDSPPALPSSSRLPPCFTAP